MGCPVTAQNPKTLLKDSLSKEWEKLELFKEMAKKELPGFGFYAALVYDGEIISEKNMGYANRTTKLLLDRKTIFPWGSISKMFTSIAVQRLIHHGKLKLTTPIIKYVPELGRGIDSLGGMQSLKIHHLLNHNSGINLQPCYKSLRKAYPRFKNSIPSIQEMMPFLKHATQRFKPGIKYRYSNGAYSLLGVIIERVTGTKFIKYVKKHIFKPLGMKKAHYGVTSKRLSKFYTRSYFRNKNNKLDTMNFDVSQGFQEGNGGVKATTDDMLKFMDFLRFRKRTKYLKRYEKVLTQQQLKQCYLNVDVSQLNNNFALTFTNKALDVYRFSGFMGVKSKQVNSFIIGHSGDVAFHTSYFYFNQTMPFGVMLIINSDGVSRKSKESQMNSKLFRAIRDFAITPKFSKTLYTWKRK